MIKEATMVLTKQSLSKVYVSYAYGIQWNLPDGSIRRPEETKQTLPYPAAFHAGGKVYNSIEQLRVEKLDEDGHICRDIYGREVFAQWERFPCFDSYDYLYENRYYRWFYIRSGDQLTCVYYADQRDRIEITEDVAKLPQRCWEAMAEAKWQQ